MTVTNPWSCTALNCISLLLGRVKTVLIVTREKREEGEREGLLVFDSSSCPFRCIFLQSEGYSSERERERERTKEADMHWFLFCNEAKLFAWSSHYLLYASLCHHGLIERATYIYIYNSLDPTKYRNFISLCM